MVGILTVMLIAAQMLGPVKSSNRRLSASVDLRPEFEARGLDMRRQGARGTCSVFAVTGALEFALTPKNGTPARLSVEFLNWAAHKGTGRAADGGFFSEIWEV